MNKKKLVYIQNITFYNIADYIVPVLQDHQVKLFSNCKKIRFGVTEILVCVRYTTWINFYLMFSTKV